MVAAADRAAARLGIRPSDGRPLGLTLAEAELLAPGLATAAADPEADAKVLHRLAAWCLRYAPLAGVDPPNGLWIDVTGCMYFCGGEVGLLADLLARLAAGGFTARAAIAGTPGAAHALARYGRTESIVVPQGGLAAALAPLPPAALRLPEGEAAELVRLGIREIGALAALPRGPLARRFGAATLRRLDQALGRVAEPIMPIVPPAVLAARLAFAEPLSTAEALAAAIDRLAETLCRTLERAGQGARQLDLFFERTDRTVIALRVGAVRPTRNARHLARLLRLRLEEVDPGSGVEAMRLAARLAEPFAVGKRFAAGEGGESDLAMLVDRLANRVGPERLYRAAVHESDVPERSVRRVAALAPAGEKTWPPQLPRPARLFAPPEPVGALALLPDHPPAQFVWRGRRRRLAAGDGPERIYGEWWRNDAETFAVRDYFRVEDEVGRRYWLYRRGDGADPASGDGRWFLHGFF